MNSKPLRASFLAICSFVLALAGYSAAKNENALEALSRKIGHDIGARVPQGSPLALEPFSDSTGSDFGRRLASIAQRVIREALLKEPSLVVTESEKIRAILENMELQLSGVFDPEKTAAVGKLIGAKYLCLGEIADEPDGYRLVVRVVELETGAIVFEDGATFLVDGAKEIVRFYAPPGYRLTVGGSWQSLKLQNAYSLSPSLGFNWSIDELNTLMLNASIGWYPGDHKWFNITYNSQYIEGPDRREYYDVRKLFWMNAELSLAYGRNIIISPFFLVRPKIDIGCDYYSYNSQEGANRQYTIPPYDSSQLLNENIAEERLVPFLGIGAAVVLSNDSPLGFWMDIEYQRFFSPIEGSLKLDLIDISESIDWALKASFGLQFHL